MPALSPLPAASSAAITTPPAKLPPAAARAAQEFESMFLAQMMAPMFENSTKSSLFGGAGQEIWNSLLTQEYGRAMAAHGGIGIGQSMMRQLMQQQEAR